MGGKFRILNHVDEDFNNECNFVHAAGTVGGDASTLCGMPLVDEAEKYESTKEAVSCPHCIRELECRPMYIKKLGKWY